jgi:hypothetical protein
MKKLLLLFGIIAAMSCSDKSTVIENFVPESDGVEITVTPNETQNIYIFSANVKQKDIRWDFGKNNGNSYVGNDVRALYPKAGNYTVTLYYRSPKTYENLSITKEITISEDNPDIDDSNLDPTLLYLTGGIEQMEGPVKDGVKGKTWVIDSLYEARRWVDGVSYGHFGTGDPNGTFPNWWAEDAMVFAGKGFYDDEMSFFFEGRFDYVNHGTTFTRAKAAEELKARGAIDFNPGDPGENRTLYYYPDTSGWTWSIEEENGKKYLVFPDNQGFAIHYALSPHRYEILEITKNTMFLSYSTMDGDWVGVYMRFIAK